MRLAGCWARIGLIAALLMTAGCHQMGLRLPQIDPSGRRIFLPAPSSTSLVLPGSGTVPRAPRPAFTGPASPPPSCLTLGAPRGPCKLFPPRPLKPGLLEKHKRGKSGHITLAPRTIVAPVGGQVVLQSGVCGANGYYVTKQPLEWMISQDSVGHFVEVGPQQHWQRWLPGHSRKVSPNFAFTRTSTQAATITRGTPNPADDTTLLAGQGWVSLTSPSEGVSHVTVMAPRAKVWDQRLQSATIYWVDARWQTPPPIGLRAGQPHRLSTQVARSSAGVPAEGWIVRYEIVNPSAARFQPGGETVVERTVDANGLAEVDIESAAPGGDTAQVLVQIIRPPLEAGGLPRMVIGQAYTSVTWTAPGLQVEAAGPETADVNEVLSYRIQVANTGALATRDVVLYDELPEGLIFLDSQPAAQQLGNRHEWQLGDLGPGQSQIIEVRCRSEFERRFRYGFVAQSQAENLSDRAEVVTVVQRSALQIDISQPPPARVGDKVTFEIRVTNAGNRDMNRVEVIDTYPAGLEQSEREPSPIRRQLGALRSGETRAFGLSFFCRQAGNLCHTMEAIADDGQRARAQGCVEVAAAPNQPSLSIRLSAPEQAQVGTVLSQTVVVTNTGGVALTDLRIAHQADALLAPEQATDGFDRPVVDRELIWSVARLEPGQRSSVQVSSRPTGPGNATIRVAADSAEGARDQTSVQIPIAPAPAGDPVPGGAPPADNPPPAAAGQGLEVSIAGADAPMRVGEQQRLLIVINNRRDDWDRNAVLTIQLPAGLQFVREFDSPVRLQSSSEDGRTLQFQTIQVLRPNDRLRPFNVEVSGAQAGDHQVQATVTSQQHPGGVQAIKRVRVTN